MEAQIRGGEGGTKEGGGMEAQWRGGTEAQGEGGNIRRTDSGPDLAERITSLCCTERVHAV